MTMHPRRNGHTEANPPTEAPQVPQALPAMPHHDEHPPAPASSHGHGLMMSACCIPMLVIAGILVATGVAGASAILFALACTAMMAAMMFGMPGDHKQ
jgi:hypothetical protein